jgi:hypothetical protein
MDPIVSGLVWLGKMVVNKVTADLEKTECPVCLTRELKKFFIRLPCCRKPVCVPCFDSWASRTKANGYSCVYCDLRINPHTAPGFWERH